MTSDPNEDELEIALIFDDNRTPNTYPLLFYFINIGVVSICSCFHFLSTFAFGVSDTVSLCHSLTLIPTVYRFSIEPILNQ